MSTVRDLIVQSLKACGALGIGQDPLAEDTNDALYQLNLMISAWRTGANRALLYQQVSQSVVSTGSSTGYTIGPGGQIDTGTSQRPQRILSAFVRQINVPEPNSPDWPLEIISSFQDYSKITIKEQTSFPSFLYYDPGFPLGTLKLWPWPLASIYAIYVQYYQQLTSFTGLTDVISMPDGYENALFWNLTKRLAPLYKLPMDPNVMMQAKESLRVLRASNLQIARLAMPLPLTRPGIYNPYSDMVN